MLLLRTSEEDSFQSSHGREDYICTNNAISWEKSHCLFNHLNFPYLGIAVKSKEPNRTNVERKRPNLKRNKARETRAKRSPFNKWNKKEFQTRHDTHLDNEKRDLRCRGRGGQTADFDSLKQLVWPSPLPALPKTRPQETILEYLPTCSSGKIGHKFCRSFLVFKCAELSILSVYYFMSKVVTQGDN